MSRDKQIDEMAKIIDDNHGFIVSSVETAEALYNAGYRKASEVAREIFEEIDRLILDGTINVRNHLKYSDLKKKYTENKGE